MKITDYVILFMFIVWSFISIYVIKDNMAFQSIIHNEEMNRMIDNTVVYAFQKGYMGEQDGKSIIDNETVVETFLSKSCQMLWGVDSLNNRNKIWDRVLCMTIIDEEGYFICDRKGIGEKIIFSNNTHEDRVFEIEGVIEGCISEYDYKVYLPKNYGEENSQTIGKNTFMVIYRTNIISYFGEDFAECIISGAAIK